MNKRVAGAAAALAIVASGAAVSVSAVSAQDSSTTTAETPTAETPSAASPVKAPPDREAHLKAALDPLVADSTLTQDQEDKVLAALQAAKPTDGPGFGKGGMRGPGFGADAATVAKALGVTTDELATELQSGKSIAAIATEKGVDVDAVIAALVGEQNARLDAAVTAGKMTPAQADARKAGVTPRVTGRINATPGEMGGFGHGGHGGRGGRDGHRLGQDDSAGSNGTSAAPATTAPAAN